MKTHIGLPMTTSPAEEFAAPLSWAEEVLGSLPQPIAVIGNGRPARPFGEVIDRYPTVIRFNNFVVEGFEALVGSRTTIRATSGWTDIEVRRGLMEITPFAREAPQSANLDEYERRSGLKVVSPRTDINSLQIGVSKPSTGLALLALLSQLGIPADAFGFDAFESGHYWTEGVLTTSHSTHEREAILALPGITLVGTSYDYASLYNFCHAEHSEYSENEGLELYTRMGLRLQGESILEFGSGNGDLALHMQKQGNEITAYEVSRVAYAKIPVARKMLGDCLDLMLLPKEDGPSFDRMVSMDVLEHLTENDIGIVISQASRLCKSILVSISTRPSGLLGPKGENLHLTVRSVAWWVDFISKYFHVQITPGLAVGQILFEGISRRYFADRPVSFLNPMLMPPHVVEFLGLPNTYVVREEPDYFIDSAVKSDGSLIHPDVYPMAADIARSFKCHTIVDLGCGNGGKLTKLSDEFSVIGLDFGANIVSCRAQHRKGQWLEVDLNVPLPLAVPAETLRQSVVVCSAVIEHLHCPLALLAILKDALRHAPAVILSTTDRESTHGAGLMGPPSDSTRSREWTRLEFGSLLQSAGLNIAALGYSRGDQLSDRKSAIVAVLVNPGHPAVPATTLWDPAMETRQAGVVRTAHSGANLKDAPAGEGQSSATSHNASLCLPNEYVSRKQPEYFDDDGSTDPTGQVWQPDVYEMAGHIADSVGATRILDIGCGRADKLLRIAERFETVGVDLGANLDACIRRAPQRHWLRMDLDQLSYEDLQEYIDEKTVVMCSDVIEHLMQPQVLAGVLAQATLVAAAVIVSTPERVLTRGLKDTGPPKNPCHIREWQIDEFGRFLSRAGFPRPAFLGLTRSTSIRDDWHTIAVVSGTSDLVTALEGLREVRQIAGRDYPAIRQLGQSSPMERVDGDAMVCTGAQLSRDSTSVFVLTVGDPALEHCVKALSQQPLDRFPLQVIENITPFNAAFQRAVDQCETEFFVQVDEDMILFHGSIDIMQRAMRQMPLDIGMICFHLYDDDLGHPIQGVKIFRRAALLETRARDVQTSEMDLLSQMQMRGYRWVLDPTVLGRHGVVYTKETIYRRYKAMYEKDIRAWNHVDSLIVKKAADFLTTRDVRDLYALLGAWHGIVGAPYVEDREAHDSRRYGLKELQLLDQLFLDGRSDLRYDPTREPAPGSPLPTPVASLVAASGRVLIVADHYWPFSGGVESIAQDLALVLKMQGWSPEIATSHTAARTANDYLGVRIHGLDVGPGRERFTTNGSYQVRGMIESGVFEAVVVLGAPDSWSMMSLDGLNRSRCGHTRIVSQLILNEYGLDRLRSDSGFERRVAAALRQVDVRCVLSSSDLASDFFRRFGMDFVVSPNATFEQKGDGERFFQRHPQVGRAKPIVLHLASFYPEKNHLGFLEVLKRHPELDACFLFVGRPVAHDPQHVSDVQALLDADPRCVWLPGIGRDEVADLLAAAKVLVLPSQTEVAPVCLLEAMSSGLAWVASPSAGNAKELKGGVVCPVEEFPSVVGRLLGDQDLRLRLGREGHAYWRNHHNWQAVAELWGAFLRPADVKFGRQELQSSLVFA